MGDRERAKLVRFGWSWLLIAVGLGTALEAAHAFKLAPLVDDELARWLLRLGHAHGAGLAVVCLAFAASGVRLFAGRHSAARLAGRLLRAGAVLVPTGFALGAIGHPEGDPSVAIWLVPPGALATVAGLGLTAHAAWTTDLVDE